ncbi:hypothetical protein AVW11_23605 [Streptomyces amritsarensis]|uniref:Integral membrane protein n=1 Tax=Streptomyces amritsarensis TaxID=681158 RepID=A0ABX3FXN3_9ACTN|nr:hypothetical protein [Streptomyces amritsarensis]OLZ62180.1 hypothetical protein AVW11_23605 [Streptomyces amritsarensis]
MAGAHRQGEQQPGAAEESGGEVPRIGAEQGYEERAEYGDPQGTRELVRGQYQSRSRPGASSADGGQDHPDQRRRDDPADEEHAAAVPGGEPAAGQ